MGSAKFNFVGQHHHQKTNLNEDRYLLPQNFIITPLVNMCNIICLPSTKPLPKKCHSHSCWEMVWTKAVRSTRDFFDSSAIFFSKLPSGCNCKEKMFQFKKTRLPKVITSSIASPIFRQSRPVFKLSLISEGFAPLPGLACSILNN